MVAGCLSLPHRSREVDTCLSLSLVVAGCMSHKSLLHISHCPLLLLANSHSLFQSHGMSDSHCLSDPMELLHVSHCLWLFLTFSHCLSNSMELLHVSHCLLMLLAVVTVSPILWSFCICLSVSYHCWISLTVSPILWSCCISSIVSYACWLSFTVSPVP